VPDVLDTLSDAELCQLYYEQGGEGWVRRYFPERFTRPFTFYQKDFWEWGWRIEPDTYYRPRVECEPRGVGKSTNAEAWVASLLARRKREMIGYVSLEDAKATKHFDGIKSMLETEVLLSVYPHCRPQVQKLRNVAAQWSRDAIVTESGAMVVPLSLLGSSRGWKSPTSKRFDVIVLDDIDKLGVSSAFAQKLLELLKGEILAAGDDNTVVLMPQNLIYRDSVCAKILDFTADILSDRDFKGPYALLKWYDAEKRFLPDGAMEWKITAGESVDPAISIEYAEKLLNKFGKATFDRECQQEVYKVGAEKSFREYDEIYHVITQSELARVYRQKTPPERWHKGRGLDWGTTPKHPTACILATKPTKTDPLDDCVFLVGETVLPRYPSPDPHADPELVSPGRVSRAINETQKRLGVTDSHIKKSLMSHEASAALATFVVDLTEENKQFFSKWKPKKGSGVAQVQEMMRIDPKRPHPFRRHPQTGKPLMGRPRFYIVVEDGQGELYADAEGKLRVRGAKDEKGFARLRAELPEFDERATGKDKIFDDAVDALRGMAAAFFVEGDDLTDGEAKNKLLPQNLHDNVIPTLPLEEQSAAIHARQHWLQEYGVGVKKEDDEHFYFDG
jgi:hypothetical protein